ncbi:MAG: hypothetical protein ACU84J_04700, partial [Gammaproteobacteria bacterium]
ASKFFLVNVHPYPKADIKILDESTTNVRFNSDDSIPLGLINNFKWSIVPCPVTVICTTSGNLPSWSVQGLPNGTFTVFLEIKASEAPYNGQIARTQRTFQQLYPPPVASFTLYDHLNDVPPVNKISLDASSSKNAVLGQYEVFFRDLGSDIENGYGQTPKSSDFNTVVAELIDDPNHPLPTDAEFRFVLTVENFAGDVDISQVNYSRQPFATPVAQFVVRDRLVGNPSNNALFVDGSSSLYTDQWQWEVSYRPLNSPSLPLQTLAISGPQTTPTFEFTGLPETGEFWINLTADNIYNGLSYANDTKSLQFIRGVPLAEFSVHDQAQDDPPVNIISVDGSNSENTTEWTWKVLYSKTPLDSPITLQISSAQTTPFYDFFRLPGSGLFEIFLTTKNATGRSDTKGINFLRNVDPSLIPSAAFSYIDELHSAPSVNRISVDGSASSPDTVEWSWTVYYRDPLFEGPWQIVGFTVSSDPVYVFDSPGLPLQGIYLINLNVKNSGGFVDQATVQFPR